MSFFEVHGIPKSAKKVLSLISVAVLIFFAGFRAAGVGEDDLNYVKAFNFIPHLGFWLAGDFQYSFARVWMEPGYIMYGAFLKLFSSSYIILFLGVAALSVGIAGKQYYKLSPYFFITLLLFFVHTFLYRDINQIRSAVSAAIGLMLIIPLSKKEYVKSIIIVLIAGLFHTASLSYFLLVLLSRFHINRRRLVAMILVALLLGAVGISTTLLSVLPGMGFITEKLLDYADSGHANSVTLFDITNLKNLTLFFILIMLWKKIEYKIPYFKTMVLFLTIGVAWRLAFSDFGIIAARVSTFFNIVEVVLLPCLLLAFREKLMPTLLIFIYAFLTLYLNLFIKEGRAPYEFSFSLIG
ncbi:EpsG family protein [Pseudoalteromonas rubra]|uniref:EpsG family protein n=1 Tax=Pseudoalteromonas rubra TaxID=43658 RepID=UPI0013DDE2DE|nr:EpsG family protein [Pseudoalteromonas rubra]